MQALILAAWMSTEMPTARKSLLAAILLLGFTSASRAEDTPDPCALQEKASRDAIGKSQPEFDEAQKTWLACSTAARQQKKAEFVATRDAWASSLDKLPAGGWIFLMVSPDGTYAVFGSHRHATREGNVVSLWLRYEYRESQTNPSAAGY
jgi:hypothetical protein